MEKDSKGLKNIVLANYFVKLNVKVNMFRTVGAYGPESQRMKKERQAVWFEFREMIAGCVSDEEI